MICPVANTMVKALIPVAHWDAGRLCRTKAVLDATTDKNTAPNNRPEAITATALGVNAGTMVARPNKAFRMAKAPPALARLSKPDHKRDDTKTAHPNKA